LYEELVRYALRLIADGREYDFLWDNWGQRDTYRLRRDPAVTVSPRGTLGHDRLRE